MDQITAADYRDIVQVSDPRLSPDEDTVAFIRKEPIDDDEYETTVYTVSTDDNGAQRFTAEEGSDSQPRWSPDGDHLAFVSVRDEEEEGPQLWIMPTDGGEAEQVTKVVGGVSNITWSPDSSRIAFTQSVTGEERNEGHDCEKTDDYERESPDPRVIDRHIYRQNASYIDGTRSHIYIYDLQQDEVKRITDGDLDFSSPAWGDESTLFYTAQRGEDPDDSYEYDIDMYDFERDKVETLLTTTGFPRIAVSEDNKVAYPFTPEEKLTMRQTELKVLDPETDETWSVTDTIDRTVGGFEWDPNDEYLYFSTPDEGGILLRRVPRDGDQEPDIILDGNRHLTEFSIGERFLAYAQSEWNHRGDIFAAKTDGTDEKRLTSVNEDYLDTHSVVEPEEIWFENDGFDIQGWVLTPPDFDPDQTYPLAVEIHGGPHVMWTTSGTMWHEFQTLANEGYVVFWCNPRGSTGYGEDFVMEIERDWGNVTMSDVMAGVKTVAEREYVDEANTFVTGGSFGGYMTGWIVGHSDYFDGAVAQRGVYDLASFYGSTDAFKLIEGDFGTTPWEEPSFLWEHSPVAHAHSVSTPTLVIHSDNDFRVPVNNGEMFYLFMRKNDVDTRLVRYPREGHELSRSGEPAHVVDRLERIIRWFAGYNDHEDVPKALERDPNEGLSIEENDDETKDDENES
ncbi:MAG: prolyl oligopeptidase family serine peptidase [Halobacteriaceae archaeon]